MTWWVGVPCALMATVLGAGVAGIRYNLTASMPAGLYRAVPGEVPGRGTIVVACLPLATAEMGRARGYLPRGNCPGGVMPVGKPVAAAAGDTVDVRADGLRVNGRALANSMALERDAVGRRVRGVPPGRYVVTPGELWLVSGYSARSYDSRYFGGVPASRVRAVVRPLWTVARGRTVTPSTPSPSQAP